jgi:iron complex transport system substrate-binding protein
MAGSKDVCGAVDHAAVVPEQQLSSSAPDVVIFALCGLPLERSLQAARAATQRLGGAWSQLPAARSGRVAVLDGERLLSRPGPWLVQSMEALVEVLHPEVQPCGHQGRLWAWLNDAPAGA